MNNNEKSFRFQLLADCFPVKGYKRGIIYDLNRRLYKFIPNSMIDFIEDSTQKNKESIQNEYNKEYQSIIEEYFNFLETNNFIFWMPAILVDNFPKLNLEWDYPAQIINTIIDVDENSNYNIIDILTQLEKTGCKHIQIRAYSKKNLAFYNEILLPFITSSYLSIEIITSYIEEQNETVIKEFITRHERIKAIIFHSAPFNKIINEILDQSMGNIAYTSQKIKSPKDCHNNSKTYFNVSVQFFTEAQKHHTYFNRKVAIDVVGNIKNCTSNESKFGNINTGHLSEIISNSEFQKLWFVKKDETKVCKDCEFRYMCTDSRTPSQNPDGMWEHKEECNYNPYIAKWKGEADYITVEETKKHEN